MELRCAQKGCTFEADETPDNCPVCNNPFIAGNGELVEAELEWSDYTVDELREQLTEWEVDGWNSRTAKPDLIALLEAAEAQRADADEADDD